MKAQEKLAIFVVLLATVLWFSFIFLDFFIKGGPQKIDLNHFEVIK